MKKQMLNMLVQDILYGYSTVIGGSCVAKESAN